MDVFNAHYRQRLNSFLKKWKLNYLLSGIADLLAISLAFQVSCFIHNPGDGRLFFTEKPLLLLLIATLPFWVLILNLIKFAQIPTKLYKSLFFIYFNSAIVLFFVLNLIYFFFGPETISREFLVELPFSGFFFLFLVRILEHKALKNLGSERHVYMNLVVIADDSSLPFLESILSEKKSGLKVCVIFTESALIKERFDKSIIILTEEYLGILNDIIEVDLIDEVLYLKEKPDSNKVREVIRSCEDLGVSLRLRYTNPVASVSSAVKTRIANEKFLSFKNMHNNTFANAIRRTTDINLSLFMIVVLAPVFIILASLVKLTSRGPLIMKQALAGVKGRQINLYKFRTTYITPVRESGNEKAGTGMRDSVPSMNDDLNVTAFGRFLLRSRLDRLPQLFNVLNGDILIFSLHPSLRREDQQSGIL
jgi:putative colanic acid biosysnthesis UDP-glucose lipid carrier transferase